MPVRPNVELAQEEYWRWIPRLECHGQAKSSLILAPSSPRGVPPFPSTMTAHCQFVIKGITSMLTLNEGTAIMNMRKSYELRLAMTVRALWRFLASMDNVGRCTSTQESRDSCRRFSQLMIN